MPSANPVSPESSPHAASGSWIDHHLLLNVLAVLRHRVQQRQPESLDVLDALSGYYANGHYLQTRDSSARLDYWADWFECSIGMLKAIQKGRPVPMVTLDLGVCDDAFDLRPIRSISAMVLSHLERVADHTVREIAVRREGTVLRVVVDSDDPDELIWQFPLPESTGLDPARQGNILVSLRSTTGL